MQFDCQSGRQFSFLKREAVLLKCKAILINLNFKANPHNQMPGFPEALKRQLIPNGHRRAPWHDYYSRSIYLITLNAAKGIPAFSTIKGMVGDRQWPPTAVKTPLGELIASCISSLKNEFPFIQILRRSIMPEHVHFVIFITEKTENHLSKIISHLKGECSRRFAGMDSKRDAGFDQILPSVFEEGYHDRILLKKGQLQSMLRYVTDNPRRRLIRKQNPDFFYRKHIQSFEGMELEAYGNLQLLEDPDIEAVKISSKYSPEELRRRKIRWKRNVENCGVLASPFISKGEKKVRDWAIENGGRLIYILDNGFGPQFTPKGLLHQLCSEGRLLLIAPAEHSLKAISRDKSYWQRMNRLAEFFAGTSASEL